MARNNVQIVGLNGAAWDHTPAVDKGLLIGGGSAFVVGSVLALAGNRMGGKVVLGLSAGIGAVLLMMAANHTSQSGDHATETNPQTTMAEADAALTDVIGGTAIMAGVTTAFLLMMR